MKLDFLKFWHRSFALNLEYLIQGNTPSSLTYATVGDAHACQMGKWIEKNTSKLAHLPAFSELNLAHQAFHQLAAEIVQRHSAGSDHGATPLLPQLKASVEALVAQIDAFDEIITRHNIDISIVRDYRPEDLIKSIWTDSLVLGIPIIDEQHHGLARLIDAALAYGHLELRTEIGSDFLANFQKLLALHCDTEEMLMDQHAQTPNQFAWHKKDHSKFLDAIVEMQMDAMFGNKKIVDAVPMFKEMLVDHILNDDRDMAKVFQNARQQ